MTGFWKSSRPNVRLWSGSPRDVGNKWAIQAKHPDFTGKTDGRDQQQHLIEGRAMSERIPRFAEEMTPAIAEMAGEMIREIRSPNRNDQETAAEFIWSRFQAKHRVPACQ